ncbi:hypothetical protein A1O3_06584 [Capronia epimyces CBS 606.96]|uniref:Luciferase-like domain-containing protein n=1 Tax=Capronia epimyces CBS 606.96 TaxID=1182542 RepID=W9YKI2_9EURO|nr:uncharacterized protein A1O3_06584 [Capronia epimyces CBS 606.96]EXJ82769.1 hypothetical protein A1O3_06584 [Capronia epimyces CBS 606.96]
MTTTTTVNGSNPEPTPKPKQLILNAFVMNTPGHLSPGLWTHPRNKTADHTKLKFWTDLAQLLDNAGFHALFVADVLGGYDVYKGPQNIDPALASGAQFPVTDPLFTVPSMAAVTKNLAFGITASTTYDQPYTHARRFSTVDHLAEGRVAWNIVTSHLDSAARNLGLDAQIEHDERYRIADEFMDVVYKLWEGSFQDSAVVRDVEKGIYIAPGTVRQIHHRGKYYKSVPGPHLVDPSPQRTPFLFQAGISKSGREFGAKHAEAIFVGGTKPEIVRQSVDAIRTLAKEKFGRDPRSIKILSAITLVVAETDEAAQRKHDELLSYGNKEGALALLGGWTGLDLSKYGDDDDLATVEDSKLQGLVALWSKTAAPGTKWNKAQIVDFIIMGGMGAKIVGGPKTVADELERWAEVADLDGYNIAHVTNPGSFEDIIEFLLPELQKRGLFRTKVEKEGATAREAYLGHGPWLRDDHYGKKFRWHAGKEPPSYDSPEFGQYTPLSPE